jgi:tight adherence protein B
VTAAAVVLAVLAVVVWPGPPAPSSEHGPDRVAGPRSPRSTWSASLVSLPQRRSGRARDGEVVALLDALAAGLGAGLTPVAALQAAVSAGGDGWQAQAVTPVLQAVSQGGPAGPAWERVARRTGHPDLAALARAWGLSERLGCPLSEAVRSTAAASRSRTHLRQRLESATAGTRATSVLLSLLPLSGLAVAPLLGLTLTELYGTAAGATSLAAGVVLLLFGRWSVERMVTRVVSAT